MPPFLPRRLCSRLSGLSALLFGAAAVLAGCGNHPYPGAERDQPLIYATLLDDPKTLDPAEVYNIADGTIAAALYSSYLQYHYLKRDPFVLEPALGATMPVREPWPMVERTAGGVRRTVGERWTFRVKPGLRYPDDPCFPGGRGREITAADFLHSFKRMADPSVNCPVVSFLTDKVLGFGAYHEHQRKLSEQEKPADYSFPVAGLQEDPRDPYVFRIVLNQPYPQLRYLMAMSFTAPVPPEARLHYGRDLRKHPVATGPYVLERWQPKERLVLRPNPAYRRDDFYPAEGMPGDREAGLLRAAGERLPLNGGVVVNVLRESITGWNLFQQGYLDAYAVTQENYAQAVSRVGTVSPRMEARGVSLSRSTSPTFTYLAFNMEDPLVGGKGEKQRKLRQALSLAYRAEDEIRLFNAGLGRPAQWIIPPGVTGFDPDYRNPYRQVDLERAKQLLAEAGYPGGVDPQTGERLTINYDNNGTTPVGRQFVAFVQKQFAQLGVRLESRSWRTEVWADRLDKGQFQLMSYGWVADYPDAENFTFLLYSPNRRPGPNATAYSDPEYDRLFERMRAMDDGPERNAIIRRMRDIAVEDCPYILRAYDEDLILRYAWMGNVQSHPMALDVWKYREVDAGMRARLRAEWNRPNTTPLALALLALTAGAVPAVVAVRRRAALPARRRR